MKYRDLGKTGMQVSEVGLGTWSFASRAYGDVDRSDAEAVVREALDGGITLFDTAPLYGSSETDGISERILGEALGDRRDRSDPCRGPSVIKTFDRPLSWARRGFVLLQQVNGP